MPWPAKIGHCRAHYTKGSMKFSSTQSSSCSAHGKRRYRDKVMSQQCQQVQSSCSAKPGTPRSNQPRIHPMSIEAKHSNLHTSSMKLTGLRHTTSLALCEYLNKTHWVSRIIRTLVTGTELVSAVVYLRINMAVIPRLN